MDPRVREDDKYRMTKRKGNGVGLFVVFDIGIIGSISHPSSLVRRIYGKIELVLLNKGVVRGGD